MIRIEDIAFVRFAAPDLGAMRAFLEDFGFSVFERDGLLYARGHDGSPFLHVTEPGDPAFRGLGFRAANIDDLQRLAAAENVPMVPSTTPGGGMTVRLQDPDGFVVDVIVGQEHAPPDHVAQIDLNTPARRARLRATVRVPTGPSSVFRLGHCVLNVSNFRASEQWYKERFGFIMSDEIEAAPGFALGAFLRCDRGERPTDHHTLFLLQAPQGPGFNHAAFEVAGLDTLMTGHDHLQARGHRPAWGVGRHKLGSQIFDYWRDPWGHELEHWTDGDLFTAADAPSTANLADLIGVQWGQPFPGLGGVTPGEAA